MVPDICRRFFWKKPVVQYIDEVNKVVFIDDYLNSYEDEDKALKVDDILETQMEKQQDLIYVSKTKSIQDRRIINEIQFLS